MDASSNDNSDNSTDIESDEFWRLIEHMTNCTVPKYIKNLLKSRGFDNILAIKNLNESDIQYLEAFARQEDYKQSIPQDAKQKDYLWTYIEEPSKFEIVRGHRIMLLEIAQRCLKEYSDGTFVAWVKNSNQQLENVKSGLKRKGDLLCRTATHPRANINEAKEYFHRAIQNGRQIESHQKLALIYKEENNFPKAIEILEHSLQIIPENVDVLTEIGILYLKVNDSKNAFEKLYQATKLDENCTKAIMALGAILQSKNDIDGALNKYKLVNTSTEDCAEIWNNIGLCFFKKKKFIAAISCLKKSIWMSPLNFSCLYNLGLVCLSARQYASAYQSLSAAINLRPNYAECYMLSGVCFKNLNDTDNAHLAFERAAMLPEAIKNPLIYLNFAIHCYETGRIEQAQLNLSNFAKMTEQMKVRIEIGKAFEKLSVELSKYDEISNTPTESQEDNANNLDNGEDRNDEENFQENLV